MFSYTNLRGVHLIRFVITKMHGTQNEIFSRLSTAWQTSYACYCFILNFAIGSSRVSTFRIYSSLWITSTPSRLVQGEDKHTYSSNRTCLPATDSLRFSFGNIPSFLKATLIKLYKKGILIVLWRRHHVYLVRFSSSCSFLRGLNLVNQKGLVDERTCTHKYGAL